MADSIVSAPDVEQLAQSFSGPLLRDGDDGYDEARRVWNGTFDRRPALIARCEGVGDVQAALRFATAAGLPVAVRGGGHSVQGYGSWDDAVVIDLSPMRGVTVDPDGRTVRAQGGTTWARAVRRSGSTVTTRIGERSMTTASSHDP